MLNWIYLGFGWQLELREILMCIVPYVLDLKISVLIEKIICSCSSKMNTPLNKNLVL